jgi:hypothetical protein
MPASPSSSSGPAATASRRSFFEQPDRCVIDRRRPNKHLVIGVGIHKCIGMPLAQLELRVALESCLCSPARAGAGSPGPAARTSWPRWGRPFAAAGGAQLAPTLTGSARTRRRSTTRCPRSRSSASAARPPWSDRAAASGPSRGSRHPRATRDPETSINAACPQWVQGAPPLRGRPAAAHYTHLSAAASSRTSHKRRIARSSRACRAFRSRRCAAAARRGRRPTSRSRPRCYPLPAPRAAEFLAPAEGAWEFLSVV